MLSQEDKARGNAVLRLNKDYSLYQTQLVAY